MSYGMPVQLRNPDGQPFGENNPFPIAEPRGTPAMIAVTSGATGTIAAANPDRLSLVFRNWHATAVMWIKAGGAAASGDGYPLLAGEQFEDSSTGASWTYAMAGGVDPALYGIEISAQ